MPTPNEERRYRIVSRLQLFSPSLLLWVANWTFLLFFSIKFSLLLSFELKRFMQRKEINQFINLVVHLNGVKRIEKEAKKRNPSAVEYFCNRQKSTKYFRRRQKCVPNWKRNVLETGVCNSIRFSFIDWLKNLKSTEFHCSESVNSTSQSWRMRWQTNRGQKGCKREWN